MSASPAPPAPYHLEDFEPTRRSALLDMAQAGRLRLYCLADLFARSIPRDRARAGLGSRWSVTDETHNLQVRWTPPEGSLLGLATWTGDFRRLAGPDAPPVRVTSFAADAPPPPDVVRDALAREGFDADPAGFELRGTAGPEGILVALGDLWVQHEDAVAARLIGQGRSGDVRPIPPDRWADALDDAASWRVRLWVRESPDDRLDGNYRTDGAPGRCDGLGNPTGEILKPPEPHPSQLAEVSPAELALRQRQLDGNPGQPGPGTRLGFWTRKRRRRRLAVGVRTDGQTVTEYIPEGDDEELREAFDGAPAGYLLINASGTDFTELRESGRAEAAVVREDGATGRVPVRMEDVVVLAEDFERRRYGAGVDPILPRRDPGNRKTRADLDRANRNSEIQRRAVELMRAGRGLKGAEDDPEPNLTELSRIIFEETQGVPDSWRWSIGTIKRVLGGEKEGQPDVRQLFAQARA